MVTNKVQQELLNPQRTGAVTDTNHEMYIHTPFCGIIIQEDDEWKLEKDNFYKYQLQCLA